MLTVGDVKRFVANLDDGLPVGLLIEFEGKGQWEAPLNDVAIVTNTKNADESTTREVRVMLIHEPMAEVVSLRGEDGSDANR